MHDGAVTVLDRRALNRATLDRQLLLGRSDLPVPAALERLVGLQAQTPHTWYLGLWSRLADFDPDATGRLLHERTIVRIALMRSTIHLVTAADCLWLRPLVQPVLIRMMKSNFDRGLVGVDRAELVVAGRALLDEEPLTFHELGRRLAERWPDNDPRSMAQAVRAYAALVQVPPRGVWGRSGPVAHTTVDTWLGRPVDADPSPATLVRRYLAAFGPATVRDIQHWSGVTRLAAVVDDLRSTLAVFRDEDGRELFDLPDAPRPDPDDPAPVRYIYEFDNLRRSHTDTSRVLTVDLAAHGFTGRTGQEPCVVLVDGFVAATWSVVKKAGTATLHVLPFRRLTTAERVEVVEEGAAMLRFAEPGADHDVVVEHPVPG